MDKAELDEIRYYTARAAKRLGVMVRLLAESKSLTTRAEQAEAERG